MSRMGSRRCEGEGERLCAIRVHDTCSCNVARGLLEPDGLILHMWQ